MAVFRIPAIVATLGTLAIYRGGVIVLAGGRQISATVLPDSYGEIARVNFAGVPLLVWLAVLLTVGFGLATRSRGPGETCMRLAVTRRARTLQASPSVGILPWCLFYQASCAGSWVFSGALDSERWMR